MNVNHKTIAEQILSAAMSSLVRQENLLVVQAISMRLGVEVEAVNPFDYINRMSRSVREDGTVFFMDGSPILWIGRPMSKTVYRFDISLEYLNEMNTPYKFLGDHK